MNDACLMSVWLACFCLPLSWAGESGEWVSLFNGRDLEGWTPKFCGHPEGQNLRQTFRVEDGVLKVSYADWSRFDGEFGHLFYQGSYSHYRLRLEYRFTGGQVEGAPAWARLNSGVMIHGQAPEEMLLEQEFPKSIEVQLLGAREGETRGTGNLCTPGTDVELDGKRVTRHVIDASGPSIPVGEWTRLEVEVRGGRLVKHFINGRMLIEYGGLQLDGGIALESGSISLQAESADCEFRKIELQLLEP